MKIRNGFVSNSSSSSFIISINAANENDAYKKLRKIITKDNWDCDGTRIHCVGKDKCVGYFKKNLEDKLIYFEKKDIYSDLMVGDYIKHMGIIIDISKKSYPALIRISDYEAKIKLDIINSKYMKIIKEE
jgi:hypothetical protein